MAEVDSRRLKEMKTYNIYKHPTEAVEAIKAGWSWPGFWFPIVWLFVKKHFVLGGLSLALMFILLSTEESMRGLNGQVSLGFDFMVGFLLGLWGNDLRMKSAERRGFALVMGGVQAHTPEGAIAAYLEQPPNSKLL